MRLLLSAALGVYLVLPAGAAAFPCLSKAQAKHKWPDVHLYWHGEDRCWDNRRHADPRLYDTARSKPSVGHPKAEPEDQLSKRPRPIVANVTVQPDEPIPPPKRPIIIYPEVIKTYANSYWMRPELIHTWPRLIEIDVNAKFSPWLSRVSGAFGGTVTKVEH